MAKKFSVLFLSLAIAAFSAGAQEVSEKSDPVPTDQRVGEQIVAIPQTPPSEAVNYVEESEIAYEMQQAKKAEEDRKAKQQVKAENARKYDSFGGGITIIAMCIVVGALIVLSILFMIFGKISSWFITHKKKQTAKVLNVEPNPDNTKAAPDTGEVIAAISAALAQHFAVDHDMQNTILTIKRMRKAYSPWNSKIYNMRQQPEVIHSQVRPGNKK